MCISFWVDCISWWTIYMQRFTLNLSAISSQSRCSIPFPGDVRHSVMLIKPIITWPILQSHAMNNKINVFVKVLLRLWHPEKRKQTFQALLLSQGIPDPLPLKNDSSLKVLDPPVIGHHSKTVRLHQNIYEGWYFLDSQWWPLSCWIWLLFRPHTSGQFSGHWFDNAWLFFLYTIKVFYSV